MHVTLLGDLKMHATSLMVNPHDHCSPENREPRNEIETVISYAQTGSHIRNSFKYFFPRKNLLFFCSVPILSWFYVMYVISLNLTLIYERILSTHIS